MEISQFGDSIPQKELTYIDMGHLIHFDFRKAGAFPHVEDDVLETTEGLPAKKAQPQGTTKHYTIQNYSVLQRTTTYKVLRRTTKYPLLQTRKYYAVYTPKYSSILQSTTPYYKVLPMHLAWKIQHFALRRSPRNLTKCCAYHEKCDSKIIKYYLSRKVRLQNQQMARVQSKVTLQHHQMLRLQQKMSSFPFLTVTLLLLSWLACSISQL